MAMTTTAILLSLLCASPLLPDPVTTTKTIKKDKTESVFSGDGTACKTITVKNASTAGHIEVTIRWADGSTTGPITLEPGEEHPIVCLVENIDVKAVGADATVETTIH
jgi:hypothetical protein